MMCHCGMPHRDGQKNTGISDEIQKAKNICGPVGDPDRKNMMRLLRDNTSAAVWASPS